MIKLGQMVSKGVNWVQNDEIGLERSQLGTQYYGLLQMVLKGVIWVHNDKIRPYGLERIQWVHNDRIRSYGIERIRLGTQ